MNILWHVSSSSGAACRELLKSDSVTYFKSRGSSKRFDEIRKESLLDFLLTTEPVPLWSILGKGKVRI